MQKIFVLSNRAAGMDWDRYRKWAVDSDMKSTPFNAGIIRMDVWRVAGTLDGEPPFEIAEELEVDSWEAYLKICDEVPRVRDAVREWTEVYTDSANALVLYCNKINTP